MREDQIKIFFQDLGEIWRDITAIEFLMRCAITKKDGEMDKFPKPPYTKGRSYHEYPRSFSHLSFEIVVAKFNGRFPKIVMPQELVQLRDAMAHGVTTEINKSGVIQLVKFKENKKSKELKVEFSLDLQLEKIVHIRRSLVDLRRCIMKEIDENALANTP